MISATDINAEYEPLDLSRQLIVSTHTISLQEQLETSDLPKCRRLFQSQPALARYAEFKSAVLVGKSNYLCTTRLAHALADRATLLADAEYDELKRITGAGISAALWERWTA